MEKGKKKRITGKQLARKRTKIPLNQIHTKMGKCLFSPLSRKKYVAFPTKVTLRKITFVSSGKIGVSLRYTIAKNHFITRGKSVILRLHICKIIG